MEEDVDDSPVASLVFDLHSFASNSKPSDRDKPQVQEQTSSTHSLVECSELGDDVLQTIYCNDWKEAAVGWCQAAPYVKYAWYEPKKRSVEGNGEGKKHKGSKQRNYSREFNWRSTVEPGTYRYSPGGGIKHQNLEQDVTASNPDDILRHLEKVRDHFERTLKCANQPAKLPHKKEKLEHSCQPQKSVSEGAVRELENKSHLFGRREGELDQSASAECLKQRPSRQQQEKLNHMWQQYQVHKVEINNPFIDSADNHHQTEATQYLKLTHARKSPLITGCHSEHHIGQGYLTSSSFTGWTNSPSLVCGSEPILNPLKKVTPQQRRIHDDSEVFTELHLSNKTHPFASQLPCPDVKPLTSEAIDEKKEIAFLPTERFEQLCFKVASEPNHQNVPSNGSQEPFSLGRELQSVQDILQAQKYLSKQLKKKPERWRYKPHRLKMLPSHAGAGDLSHGKRDLGEPLHRGIIDRKTASDLATELLPGVHGQRLEPPLYTYRIM